MDCKNASLVINPRTGQNVTHLPDVLSVLSAAGWQTEVALKEYGGHIMSLAQDSCDNGNELVIGYGGDGTLNQVVNGVMHSGKKKRSVVGVIPGGTANLWSGDIGVPVEPVKAALALVNSNIKQVDVGRVSVQEIAIPGEDAEEPTIITVDHGKKAQKKINQNARNHFLLMAGFGFDATVMNDVSKPLKYRIGPAAVGLSIAKHLPRQQAFPLELHALGKDGKGDLLWKGEALQVIIGNTRRYAMVLETTPDAYIDDGILDVCVIIAGDPLTTVQQITSLLLRRKPDNTVTENFQGAHLCLKMPASVSMEVDGSSVKLKDFLGKEDSARFKQLPDLEKIMVTYRLDAVSHALNVAIPTTYDDGLFEHTQHEDDEKKEHAEEVSTPYVKNHGEVQQTAQQEKTESAETQPEHTGGEVEDHEQTEAVRAELPELVNALLNHGRKVTVVGKVPDPKQKKTYIIAGKLQKDTGDTKPVAVVVSKNTTLFDQQGIRVSEDAVKELHEGAVMMVEGKQSKRGVIHATRAIL